MISKWNAFITSIEIGKDFKKSLSNWHLTKVSVAHVNK